MAVAAADFYSYAKATGTPLPKSKQEEAQLAPAVNNWKKSRLKAPERERDSGDLGNVLGGGAIAAGLAGAALYGYRRGWGDSPAPRKPAPTGNLPSEIPTRVYTDEQRPVDLKGTRNKETGTYRASVNEIQKEQPQSGTQVRDIAGEEALWDANYWANFHAIKRANPSWNIADIDKQAVFAAKQATNQPIRKGYVPGPATDNRINLQEIPESSPVEFSPLEYVKSTGAVEPTVQVTNVDTPRDLLALRAAPTYKDTTLPEQLYVQQKLAELQTGPKALESLGDEQIDVIRGTVANAKLYPQTTSEVRRQEARMRTNDKIAQEGIDELLGREFVDDTLVAQQKTIAPELADQSLESANSGYQQMDDKLDRSVQRDTDSIAVGNQAVELEKTQQGLLEDAKLKAAAAIENRRLQLQQDTNLDPRSTRFDNALAREWATKPNVDPSIGSEDFRKTVQAPKDVEDFISTEIPETDASNVARNYYNEDTGNIQFATEDGGSPLIRDIYKEKVLPSEDVSNAASGGVIRGQSRSMDIQEPQRRTRTDEFTGDISPDTPGGLTGFPKGPRPRGVQFSNEARDQPVTLANPTGKGIIAVRGTPIQTEALPLNQRAPRNQVQSLLEGEVERIDDYATQGGGAGMGVYGRQLGYVPGPESKTVTGLRSTESGKLVRSKPTDVPLTKTGREFNPQTKRDEFRDLSNDTLRKIITQGTYRSGKMGRTAIEAQYELKLRKDLGGKAAENYAPNIEKAKKSMEVSRDIQNIYNSGRPDAQQQVQAYIQGLRKGQQF